MLDSNVLQGVNKLDVFIQRPVCFITNIHLQEFIAIDTRLEFQ